MLSSTLMVTLWMSTLWRVIHNQTCAKQLSLISDDEFDVIFNPDAGDVINGVSALECINRCLYVGYHIHVVLYSRYDRLCSCRESYSVNTAGQRDVYVIDLNRSSMYNIYIYISVEGGKDSTARVHI